MCLTGDRLAGSDTTATAIRATLLHIICNARVLNKLRAEMERARPTWPVISDAEARAMPYLQATIKEGLRMFPPVAGLMAKEVPRGGDTFKGVYLPAGTHIGYCAWGVARWPAVWGSDADEFRPERWLEAPAEKLREMEGTVELVFGYGRWQCLGRNVALMELNKVLVEVSARRRGRAGGGTARLTGTAAAAALRPVPRRPDEAVEVGQCGRLLAGRVLAQGVSAGRAGLGGGTCHDLTATRNGGMAWREAAAMATDAFCLAPSWRVRHELPSWRVRQSRRWCRHEHECEGSPAVGRQSAVTDGPL